MNNRNKKSVVFSKIKQSLVDSPAFVSSVSYLTRKQARIFIYHRFCNEADLLNKKIDKDTFEWQMQKLKGWNVITLGMYLQLKLSGQELPHYIVILTIDDGYKEFYDIVSPILKKYGLTATFFPTVNFIEGDWLWWDRLVYSLQQTNIKKCAFIFHKELFNLEMDNRENILESWGILSSYCVRIKNDEKWSLISKLERELDVNVPVSPPAEFSSVTWQQLKEMSEHGVEIGGHTLTHPILSQVQDSVLLDKEIREAKIKLEVKINKPVLSFCYPNGKKEDISESVVDIVKKSGYSGAVTTDPYFFGCIDPYRIPRMGVDNDKVDFLWKLCGMENILNKIKILCKYILLK